MTDEERPDPYLVIVIRKGCDPVCSLTLGIGGVPSPRTPEDAMKRVMEYAGPLQDGDTLYVIPSRDVAVFRARGLPTIELEKPVGKRMM